MSQNYGGLQNENIRVKQQNDSGTFESNGRRCFLPMQLEPNSGTDVTDSGTWTTHHEKNTGSSTSLHNSLNDGLDGKETNSTNIFSTSSDENCLVGNSSLLNSRNDTTQIDSRQMRFPQPSLFGAVMKKIADPKTPNKTVPLSSTYRPSPGGSRLREFLNNDLTSPFQVTLDTRISSIGIKHGAGNDSSIHPISTTTKIVDFTTPRTGKRSNRGGKRNYAAIPGENVEWHECFLRMKRIKNEHGNDIIANDSVGIIDWSIKSKVHVQCHSLIPFLSENLEIGTGLSLSQTEDLHRISKINSILGTMTDLQCENNLLRMRFHSSLLYWQYPSNTSHPTKRLNDHRKRRFSSDVNKINRGDYQNVESMQGPGGTYRNSTFSVLGEKEAKKYVENSNSILRKEWQQSFRSIYLKWLHRIQILQKLLNQEQENCRDNRDDNCSNKNSIVKLIVDTYFYVVNSDDHTLLFRIGMPLYSSQESKQVENVSQPTAKENTLKLVPEILISSSTYTMRQQLRARGINLMLMESWDNGNYTNGNCSVTRESLMFTKDFESKVLGTSTLSSDRHDTSKHNITLDAEHIPTKSATKVHQLTFESTLENSVESPVNIQSELVALRRAQLLGQTVGADVAVSTKHHKSGLDRPLTLQTGRTPLLAPPLAIEGIDDCANFCELYLNTVGFFDVSMHKHTNDAFRFDDTHENPTFPLILCRKLGPFLHSSLKSVQVECNDRSLQTKAQSLVLVGCLLPCAIRDFTEAAIQSLLEDQLPDIASDVEPVLTTNVLQLTPKKISKSHHFVMKTKLYEQPPLTFARREFLREPIKRNESVLPMGCPTSKLFNGTRNAQFLKLLQNRLAHNDSINRKEIHNADQPVTSCSCLAEQWMKMVVWDVAQPSVLAFSLDRAV